MRKISKQFSKNKIFYDIFQLEQMYEIENPSYFLLFFIIPAMVILFVWVLIWKRKKQRAFANSTLLDQLSPDRSTFKSVLKFFMICLTLSFLIAALANPKSGTVLKTVKRQGVDLVFALDVSKSMLAEDIAPNRLEKAKQIIAKTIDILGGDRIGIIVYAGNSYPLLPITTDHASAVMFLQNASPNLVSSHGTAIDQAIERAITYFDNDEQTNRFLFVVSDGEDHENKAIDLAEKAKKEGVKTYTIGVGDVQGAPIPEQKSRRGIVSYKRDQKGQVVITKMNPKELKQIAKTGGGTFIDGNNTQKAVEEIQDLLIKAEKSEFQTKKFSDYKDHFQWFIGFGLLFLIFDSIMLDKKTKWIAKLNLFNQKKQEA